MNRRFPAMMATTLVLTEGLVKNCAVSLSTVRQSACAADVADEYCKSQMLSAAA